MLKIMKLNMIKITREYAGMYTATLSDGRDVELSNNRIVEDDSSYDNEWLIRIDGSWWHTLGLLRDAKRYIRFIDTFGDNEGNKLFWQ
jgi:hypothetical protein